MYNYGMNYDSEILRENIKRLMKTHNVSLLGWTKKAGISESGLRSFLSGLSESIQLKNAIALCAAIDITINEFLGIEEDEEKIDPKMVEKAVAISSIALSSRGHDIDPSRVTFMTEKLLAKYLDIDSLSSKGPDYIDGFFDS